MCVRVSMCLVVEECVGGVVSSARLCVCVFLCLCLSVFVSQCVCVSVCLKNGGSQKAFFGQLSPVKIHFFVS